MWGLVSALFPHGFTALGNGVVAPGLVIGTVFCIFSLISCCLGSCVPMILLGGCSRLLGHRGGGGGNEVSQVHA